MTDPIADMLTRIRNAHYRASRNRRGARFQYEESRSRPSSWKKATSKSVENVEDGLSGKIVITLKYAAGRQIGYFRP